MDIELVTDPYACMTYIVSPLAGLGGGILWRPAAYSLFYLSICCPPNGVKALKDNINSMTSVVYLAGCDHIKRVRFHHCAYVDDDTLLAMVERLKKSLQQLELSSCDISDEGLGHLTQLKSVYYYYVLFSLLSYDV